MLTGKNILITGANGFIGKHLSTTLLNYGANLFLIDQTYSLVGDLKGTQYVFDLKDSIKVVDIFTSLKPDYVIHLAASKNRANDITQFRDTYNTNLSISLNVIEACRALPNFKRLIFLGTCDEYGQSLPPFSEMQRELPVNAYGLSKLAVTKILLAFFFSHRFPSVILRPTVIYGPGQGEEMFLSALIQSLILGNEFSMTFGEQRRDFIYIIDMIDAIIKAIVADDRVNGSVVNVGSGISYQIKEIATLVANQINPGASNLIKLGAVQYRPNEVMDYSVKIARAKELLKWCPRTKIKDGVKETVKHFKKSVSNHMSQSHA